MATYRETYPLPTVELYNGFGVNIHFLDFSVATSSFIQFKVLNPRWARVDLLWALVETASGVFDYSDADTVMNTLEDAGLRCVVILGYNNTLYYNTSQSTAYTTYAISGAVQMEKWLTYVENTVNRYKGKGHIWEIWNEPNVENFWRPTRSGSGYAALVASTVAKIRDIAPDEYIAVASLANITGITTSYPWFNQALSGGILDDADIVSVHLYSDTAWNGNILPAHTQYANVTRIRELMSPHLAEGQDIPVFCTEWGASRATLSNFDAAEYSLTTTASTATNIILDSENFAASSWIQYWVKPSLTTGMVDPFGTTRATRLASADYASGSGNYRSGIRQLGGTQIVGTAGSPSYWNASFWGRAVTGTLEIVFGLNEYDLQYAILDTHWRRYEFTAAVSASAQTTNFILYENEQNNVEWEVFGVQVQPFSGSVATLQSTGYQAQRQADYLVDAWTTLLSANVPMLIWYEWINATASPSTGVWIDNYGLTQWWNNPNPYPAFTVMSQVLAWQYLYAGASRYYPMDWAPRWVDGYYSDDSLLRQLYFLGLYYPKSQTKRILRDKLTPSFYGFVEQDYFLLAAKYNKVDDLLPSITYTNSTTSGSVRKVPSMSDLLYEYKDPVYCIHEQLIYFKNLDVRSVSASAASGYIEFNTELNTYPARVDSPFVLENQWGDLSYVDQESNLFIPGSGHIYVDRNGHYTVHYHVAADASNPVVELDGERLSIFWSRVENIWDHTANLFGLSRNRRETNSLLKKRVQHLSIAKKPNQRIGAALGTTVGINWYASGSAIAFPASGYKDWEFQDLKRFSYIREIPYKDGNNFILSYVPTGHVQVFLNGVDLTTTQYTISGSYIIPASSLLSNANQGTLLAIYKTQTLPSRNNPEIGSLLATNPERRTYRGILVKDVLVNNVTKKIKSTEWRWNRVLGQVDGIAEFDF